MWYEHSAPTPCAFVFVRVYVCDAHKCKVCVCGYVDVSESVLRAIHNCIHIYFIISIITK